MTSAQRALLASSILLAACGTLPRQSPGWLDGGVTLNRPADIDAGWPVAPDAGEALAPDAGDHACPAGYLAVDGGCAGPCTLQLVALATSAEGNALAVGIGPQPIFIARLIDPNHVVPPSARPVLQTTPLDSGVVYLDQLEPSVLDATPDSFRRILDTRPLPEGAYEARALLQLDGETIVSNLLTLLVDRTAPTLDLVLTGLALDGGPLPRDFVAVAVLDASDKLSGLASLTLQGAGPRVDPSSGILATSALLAAWPVQLVAGDALGQTGQAEVHAADIPFDTGGDQAGQVVLLATATDLAGNSTQVEVPIELTRLKWESARASGSRDGLVLGGTGRIYGALAFDIWGLDPSGTSAWHASPGSDATTRGAPLVRGTGSDRIDISTVDFTSGTPSSRVLELCGDDGSEVCGVSSFAAVGGASFVTAPVFDTSRIELVVADALSCGFYVLDGLGGAPLLSPAVDDGGPSSCATVEVALSGTILATTSLQGGALYRRADAGFSLSGAVGSGSWFTAGVAVSGTTAWFAAGNQLIGVDGAFSPPVAIGTFTAGGAVTAPVIDGQGNIYVASDDGVLSKLNATGTRLWSASLEGAGYLPGIPAVGADGIVYLVDGSEALDAVDPQGHLLWTTGPLFGAPIRSPMIDPCNHTLYVTAADLGGIRAVIVDSAGLDLTGDAWPVYRHDYFGTGAARANPSIDCTGHL